jgi:hypothetical protein
LSTTTYSLSITLPSVIASNNPDQVGRLMICELLEQAKTALGQLTLTSGNLTRNPGGVGVGPGPQVLGTFTYTLGTT